MQAYRRICLVLFFSFFCSHKFFFAHIIAFSGSFLHNHTIDWLTTQYTRLKQNRDIIRKFCPTLSSPPQKKNKKPPMKVSLIGGEKKGTASSPYFAYGWA